MQEEFKLAQILSAVALSNLRPLILLWNCLLTQVLRLLKIQQKILQSLLFSALNLTIKYQSRHHAIKFKMAVSHGAAPLEDNLYCKVRWKNLEKILWSLRISTIKNNRIRATCSISEIDLMKSRKSIEKEMNLKWL